MLAFLQHYKKLEKKQKSGDRITTVQDIISRWALFRQSNLFNPFPMLNEKIMLLIGTNLREAFTWHHCNYLFYINSNEIS